MSDGDPPPPPEAPFRSASWRPGIAHEFARSTTCRTGRRGP